MSPAQARPAPASIQVLGRSLWGDATLSLGQVDRAFKNDQYIAIPSLTRARYLVPASLHPAATARLLREYNALRPPAPRVARAFFASAAGVGMRLVGRRQVVTVQEHGASLRDLAASLLGRSADEVALACGVRVESGLARPTVTVVDLDGQPVLYLKIAVAPLHRRRLHAEHEGLQWHADHPIEGLEVPRPLALHDFGDREVLAVTPLPRDVRPIPPADRAHLALLQERFDDTNKVRATVAESEWMYRIRQRACRLAPPWRDLVQKAIGTVLDKYGTDEVEFGVMHGDWTSWNSAYTGAGEVALWDWEFFTPSAPRGLDALTTEHLARTTLHGESVAQVSESMRQSAAGDATAERLLDLFLLDMALRRSEEAAVGYQRQEEPARRLLQILSR